MALYNVKIKNLFTIHILHVLKSFYKNNDPLSVVERFHSVVWDLFDKDRGSHVAVPNAPINSKWFEPRSGMEMVTSTITLLNTIYKLITESTGTLLNV